MSMDKQDIRLLNFNYHLHTLEKSIEDKKLNCNTDNMEKNLETRKELYRDEKERFFVITQIRALKKVPDNYNLDIKLKETQQVIQMLMFQKETLEMCTEYWGKYQNAKNVPVMIKARKEIFEANVELPNVINEIIAKQDFLKEYKVRVDEAKIYDEQTLKSAKKLLPKMINEADKLTKNISLAPLYRDRLKEFVHIYKNSKWNFNQLDDYTAEQVRVFYTALKSELTISNNLVK